MPNDNAEPLSFSERSKLKAFIATRLIQSGWSDQIKNRCFDTISVDLNLKSKQSELVKSLLVLAKDSLPVTVKSEVYERVREIFLATLVNEKEKIRP